MIDRGAIGDSFAYCGHSYSGRFDERAEYKEENLYPMRNATLLVAQMRNQRRDFGDEE